MKKILIVEDEMEVAKITCDYLTKEGYDVVVKSNGTDALEYLQHHAIDLLLLDIMLDDIDGYTICEEVRKYSNVYIIIISAKIHEEDKLLGLELGADDYIEKPVSIKVLVARVNTLMKRLSMVNNSSERLVDGDIEIDTIARIAIFKGNEIALTNKEFDLLSLMIKNKNRVLKKEFLFNHIWGIESESEFSTLTVHINRLREKFEVNPNKPTKIITAWGIGYRYVGANK